MIPTPEHDKLTEAEDRHVVLAEFLEWLEANHLWICELVEHPTGLSSNYYPIHQPSRRVLMQFLGVDARKLEAERRAVVEACRRSYRKGEPCSA